MVLNADILGFNHDSVMMASDSKLGNTLRRRKNTRKDVTGLVNGATPPPFLGLRGGIAILE